MLPSPVLATMLASASTATNRPPCRLSASAVAFAPTTNAMTTNGVATATASNERSTVRFAFFMVLVLASGGLLYGELPFGQRGPLQRPCQRRLRAKSAGFVGVS